jgi:hypothetical protein
MLEVLGMEEERVIVIKVEESGSPFSGSAIECKVETISGEKAYRFSPKMDAIFPHLSHPCITFSLTFPFLDSRPLLCLLCWTLSHRSEENI